MGLIFFFSFFLWTVIGKRVGDISHERITITSLYLYLQQLFVTTKEALLTLDTKADFKALYRLHLVFNQNTSPVKAKGSLGT